MTAMRENLLKLVPALSLLFAPARDINLDALTIGVVVEAPFDVSSSHIRIRHYFCWRRYHGLCRRRPPGCMGPLA
ncbi:hypothetical protein F4604DRAFT_1157901 [Suillus subluteus]|nr:hypothetical protein F4604DRAFT_1157901 [Suillus subluteus]